MKASASPRTPAMDAGEGPGRFVWTGPALLSAVFVALVAWSWRRWPDVLIDFGRELYVPWQLAAGKILYADIAYFNGPLSPWINSILFRTFGVGMMTLVVANLIVLAMVAGMIYFLVREVSRPFTATVAALIFLTIFAFGQYMPQGNYNFVTPYSHEMTHGMAFSLAALVLLAFHLRRGGLGSAFACGLAVGLTFLTKAELFLAVAIAVPGGLAIHHWQSATPGRKLKQLAAAFVSGAVLPPVLAYVVLAGRLGPDLAAKSVLGSWAYLFIEELSESKLYQDILGASDVTESLGIIGGWALRYAAFLVPALLVGFFLPRSGTASRVATGLLFPISALCVLVNLRTTPWDTLAQPLSLAMLGIVATLLVWLIRASDSARAGRRNVLMLAISVFGLLLLAKIFLYVRIAHYGFALAMPAGIVCTVVLVDGVPALLDRRGRNGGAFRLAVLGILAGLVVVHLYATNSWFGLRTVEVGEGKDAFLTDTRGRVAVDVLSELGQLTSVGQTMAVLPEGVMLNYLSRIANPTPYINFMPPEFIMFGEENMVAAFEATPPDWIVLTDRHAPEYGYDLLGTDYGLGITEWIRRNYTLTARVVDESARRKQLRYAYILRRNDTPGPRERQ